MKKSILLFAAAILIAMNIAPVMAMESQFGGYWYTRFFSNQNFAGEDQSEAEDVKIVDTKTRIYYTAVFHENLKFVNKFEFDAEWGDNTLGDIGADGKVFEIKNSYADFNLGPVNFTVGIQGLIFGRSLLFDDDASGATVTYRSDKMDIQFFWLKAYEGGAGKNANDYDVDYWGFNPVFRFADAWEINPFFMYIYSDDVRNWKNEDDEVIFGEEAEEVNLWYAGLSLDANFDLFSLWLTGIYQGGDMSFYTTDKNQDFSAWLAAAGASVNIGEKADIHGQFFYATGDDGKDRDWENFWVPAGQSYYWAELMGYGIIDYNYSKNSPGDQISNIMAANIGIGFKPVSNVSITLDVWYAALAEDIYVLNGAQYGKADAPANASEENYLGTEVDLIFSVELVQGMNLDLIGAYLFAGEATTLDSKNDANPYEVGAQLSLEF
ncbi:MAG: alginate export family protein [Desulfobacterales bacterium]